MVVLGIVYGIGVTASNENFREVCLAKPPYSYQVLTRDGSLSSGLSYGETKRQWFESDVWGIKKSWERHCVTLQYGSGSRCSPAKWIFIPFGRSRTSNRIWEDQGMCIWGRRRVWLSSGNQTCHLKLPQKPSSNLHGLLENQPFTLW